MDSRNIKKKLNQNSFLYEIRTIKVIKSKVNSGRVVV